MYSKKTLTFKFILFFILMFFSSLYAENRLLIIDSVQTKKLIKEGKEGVVLIDNRPEHKFNKGHIKGAVNLPFFMKDHPTNKMTKENLLKAVNGKKIVVFYCSGYKRAYYAAKQAEEWGIKADIYWYKNGFEEWKTREPFIR